MSAGQILSGDSRTVNKTAGGAIGFGELVYLDGDGTVKKLTEATTPVYGVLANSGYDGDSVASGDTATILIEGDIEVGKKAGLALGGKQRYNIADSEISDTGLSITGAVAVEQLSDTSAVLRVTPAITVEV